MGDATRLNTIAVLQKGEATFGTDAAPGSSTDAFLLNLANNVPLVLPDGVQFDGKTGPNNAGLFPRLATKPAGRSATADLPTYFAGPGLAYSSTVVPVNGFDNMMLTCGFGKTTVTTAGTESITYVPLGDGAALASSTLYAWCRRVTGGNFRRVVVTGALGSLKFSAPGLAPPTFTQSTKGIFVSDPTEGSLTPPTYSPLQPSNAAGCTFTIDGVALKLRSIDYDSGRDLSNDRINQTSANGYDGSVAGLWTPTLKVTFEDPPQATYNPYTKWNSKATAALIYKINPGVQYNRLTCNATVQIMKVTPSNAGNIATTDLELMLVPSTPGGVDVVSFVAD